MDRSKSIVRVSVIGILANLVLVAFKAVVGLVTGSIAVLLDAVNNLSDALSSVITIVATKLAGRAPDKKHPYGYGRIEHISSVLIAIIVLLAGFTSFQESLEKVLHPEEASYTAVSLLIIAAAVAVKFLLGRYVKAQGVKLNSESLVASGTDASFDSLISLSTLVAAGISLLFHWSVEGYLGVVISVVILKAGIEMLMGSLNSIIGERVDSELSLRLKQAVCSFPEVHGAYDLVLHSYGPEKLIGSVHVEVDDTMTARGIHALTRKISQKAYNEFGIILTVGIYASNTDDSGHGIRGAIQKLLPRYPAIRQIHGYYEDGDSVSFDMVVDFGVDAMQLRREFTEELTRQFPGHSFYVNIDTDFSD
ncbi:MAG: cation transporter [Oscillospiraceae bacterium]|nr:cation transporter [Oscillospiraceae bacterium]